MKHHIDGVIDLQGKSYPTWPYVLNAAHEKGVLGIITDLVQIPSEDNAHTAIVKATCRFPDGEWAAYGDASPRNVNTKIVTALIRMAETRAKGRALRDACNIGETMKEEIGDDEPVSHTPASSQRPVSAPPPAAAPPRQAERPLGGNCPPQAIGCEHESGCGVILTLGQHTVSQRVYNRSLCPTHQREAGEQMGRIASRPAA